MTRRAFLAVPVAQAAQAVAQPPLVLPVLHIADKRARLAPDRLRRFSAAIWPEAVRDFARCDIRLERRDKSGEVRRSPGGRPIFTGLERGCINMVLTDAVPLAWDRGRGLQAVATRYEGHDVCLIAVNEAHPHQVPLLSVNTCVHELLHVLLDDIAGGRPKSWRGAAREVRIDMYATRLWLFHDGAAIRRAAHAYDARLRGVQKPSQT